MAEMMLCEAFGPLENLTLRDSPVGPPARGQVKITVKAAVVNVNDGLKVTGRHHEKPQPPFAPGAAVAGVVTEVGESVDSVAIGDRVLASLEGAIGGFATEALAPAWSTAKIPQALDFETACGFSSSYMSAYEAVVTVGKVASGDTVVVTGAAGGLGIPAIEIAKALGSRVIAIVSSELKAERAREAGADVVVNRSTEDVRARVLELTEGRGADAVIELVGGDALRLALRYIAYRGRIVVTGFTSGDIPEVRAILLLLKGFELRGSNLSLAAKAVHGHYQAICDDLFALLERGAIRPPYPLCYPLDQAVDAIKLLQTGEVIGKVALTMGNR